MAVERQEIADLVDRLNAGGSMFGQRRKAARRLASVRSPRAVRGLARAYVSGHDRQVTEIAAAAITGLDYRAGVDAACEVLIATGDERLAALLADAGHLPSKPERRALLLFLTGRFKEYAELDFDGALLAAAYTTADAGLKARLTERARTSARVEWVRAIAGWRNSDQVAALSDPEWETMTGILIAAERWDELWRLALLAPPAWGVRMLRELGQVGWQPESGADRAGFGDLVGRALACSDEVLDDLLPFPSAPVPGLHSALSGIAIIPRMLVGGELDGEVHLWRLPDGASEVTLGGHGEDHAERVNRVALSPDGRFLALLGGGASTGEATWVWELPSRQLVVNSSFFVPLVDCLTMSPDGRLLVGGTLDRRVVMWRLPDFAKVNTFDLGLERDAGYGIDFLAMTADRDLVVTGSKYGIVNLWRMPKLTPAGTLSHTGVQCATVTPDGRLLAAACRDGTVRLWRLPDFEWVGAMEGHQAPVRCIAVSPDGATLASADEDGRVLLWDLGLWRATVTPLGALDPAEADRLSSDLTGYSETQQNWAVIIAELVRWRRRYDIEVETAYGVAQAEPADIEVDGEGA